MTGRDGQLIPILAPTIGFGGGGINIMPSPGLEPGTFRLLDECSTDFSANPPDVHLSCFV